MPLEQGRLPAPQTLYDHAACGLLLTCAQGRILRVNGAFEHWLGYGHGQLLGLRVQDLLTMGSSIHQQMHWGPLLYSEGTVSEIRLECLHRSGHAVPMMISAVRRPHGGQYFHEWAAMLIVDAHAHEHRLLSAQRRAEERLLTQLAVQQAQQAAQQASRSAHDDAQRRAELAERMVGIASHDLRNPLTAIRMATQLLQRCDQEPRQARILDHIDQSAQRAQRLIEDLLDFTLTQVGHNMAVRPTALDLHAVVANCVEELQLSFAGRELRHRRSGAGQLVADADRLHQLMGNLVGNALAYGDPDAAVSIHSFFTPHAAGISVHNHGPAIPGELLEQLFEPMTRGAQTIPGQRNIGLGLYIVREIAKAHQGKVKVRSCATEGTTFTATFALAPLMAATAIAAGCETPGDADREGH